jgi:membrane protein
MAPEPRNLRSSVPAGSKGFVPWKQSFSNRKRIMPSPQTNTSLNNSGTTGDKVVTLNGRVWSIKQWAFKHNRGESRLLATLRSWLRILFIMIHEFFETAITLRASALTYSIVLSMVPMLAMGTAVLKGLGSDNQLKIAAYRIIDQFETEKLQGQTVPGQALHPQEPVTLEETAITPHPAPNKAASPTESDAQQVPADTGNEQSMTSLMRNAVDTIFNYVDRTNFAAIGAFGIVGLLLAVVLVLSTIENAMNVIWHTKQGRSIFRKIMDYLALLILLPISINVALAGDAALESPRIMSYLHTLIPSVWAVKMLLKFLPFLFVILSLMVMYQFFPNVRVKTHAAFAGAIFAGFFWFVVQRAYIVLQVGVAKYNAIYGSFATVPLFLIWIQLGWTFILLGATLAYAVQNRHQYHLPGTENSPQRNLQLAFDVLNTIYTNFAQKKSTTLDDLAMANEGDNPGNIQEITNRLVEGGLLHKTEDNGLGYVPVTPPENIEAKEVVQLIMGHEMIPTLGGEFSRQVIRAAESAIPGDEFPKVEVVQNFNETTPPEHEENHKETL